MATGEIIVNRIKPFRRLLFYVFEIAIRVIFVVYLVIEGRRGDGLFQEARGVKTQLRRTPITKARLNLVDSIRLVEPRHRNPKLPQEIQCSETGRITWRIPFSIFNYEDSDG